ncbi:hypothetical protein S40285_08093 [Stachybotrys chlorohalonatus IBT 40285]|uniref:Glycosyltransferase family 8 protein n=1 Tax=Stachybotrys chlorohalonatus (strain IBT 40285) TaxID=1283841 RepID=A0A084QD06_STAC4|nr:hypothetical protein S40285_08093 [Stachybotrys chlorohalonata IBT 40285]
MSANSRLEGVFPSTQFNDEKIMQDWLPKPSTSVSSRTDKVRSSSRRLRIIAGVVATSLLLFQFWRDPTFTLFDDRHTPAGAGSQVDVSHSTKVDWSRFAYTQYATDRDTLCNAVMIFESLHWLESKADRVLLYPLEMLDPLVPEENASDDARLLLRARDDYQVHLVPITIHFGGMDADPRTESFIKLLAFNQTSYDRVLALDSDSVLLQHMDELFLLPPATVAMPHAYWLFPDEEIFSSHVMLVQPSIREFNRVMQKVKHAEPTYYDMDIINDLYRKKALVIPHRPYNLITSEFASSHHGPYLGSDDEEWDPTAAYSEAKYIHFSDWPVTKPWLPTTGDVLRRRQPKCPVNNVGELCMAMEIWNRLYKDFRAQRERVCHLPVKR